MKASSDLGLMVPQVYLFHTRKKLKKFLASHMDEPCELYDTDGQMIYSSGVAIVLMEHRGKEDTELSLLVHEGYHAAVAHMSWLGEDDAGEETMAYLVQTITHALISAHRKWKRKKGLW